MTDEERDEEEEPEQNGGLFAQPDEAPADDGTPESAGAETPAPATQEGGGAGEDESKRLIWPWVVLGVLAGLLLLVGWTKVVNSDSYCTLCHTTQAAADTAANSVHSEVSCMACHRGVGVPGAVAYIPTFLREVVDQITPLSVASGTMDPAPCEKCHETVFASSLLEGDHPSTGCNECHGNTAHPQPPAPLDPTANPHPADWIAFHGREANKNLKACATCHLLNQDVGASGTCMACHFRGQYPHPKNWIPRHGEEQLAQGPDACTLCHASTFCVACHGTQIPHDLATWLGRHPSVVQEAGTAQQCLLCHASADCTECHLRHAVHTEQGLYVMEER